MLGYLFGFLSIGEDVNLLANVQLTALNLLDSYPYPPFFFFWSVILILHFYMRDGDTFKKAKK